MGHKGRDERTRLETVHRAEGHMKVRMQGCTPVGEGLGEAHILAAGVHTHRYVVFFGQTDGKGTSKTELTE